MQAFVDACNYIADIGREHEESAKYKLHNLCCHDVRERFGLSANLTIRALGRVAPHLKSTRLKPTRLKSKDTRHSIFRPTSVDYDARIFSFRESDWTVSLTLLTSREHFDLGIGNWQREELTGQKPTSAVLCKKRGSYYIDIQIKSDLPEEQESSDTLGVDRGINNICTLSDGTNYAGDKLNAYREKRYRVRRSLQMKAAQMKAAKGTRTSTRRNCRRLLSTLSGKERRFQKHINHEISKDFVAKAKANKQTIVLEDLASIHQSARQRKSQRRRFHSWAFYELEQFIRYKAAFAGVPVVSIDPRYTSQTCHACKHIGTRRGADFKCESCGYEADADANAARNIAQHGACVSGLEESSTMSCSLYDGSRPIAKA